MTNPQPMNRAQRRRVRRTTALAGAGLAFTGSLVGLYPGGTRVPRAYAQANPQANTGPNCSVGTWNELNAAISDLWFSVNYKVSVDATAPLVCTTITFTADITDVGVPEKVPNSSVYSGFDYPGQLENILIPPGQDITIDGNGYTLDLTGDWGSGLFASSESTGATPTDLIIRNLEITGTPFNRNAAPTFTGASLSVSGFQGNTFGLVIEDSYIHDNASTTDPAALVFSVDVLPAVTITRSEFADNDQGAVGVATYEYMGLIGDGNVTVTESYFHDNVAAGGWASDAGAITVDGPLPVSISDSTFAGNSSTAGGGALHLRTTSTVTVSNSTFRNNSGVGAGSVYAYLSDASSGGAGPEAITDTLLIDHTTMMGGTATPTQDDAFVGEEVLFVTPFADASMSLTNSVFWGSTSSTTDVYWYGAYGTGGGYASASVSNSVFETIDGQTFPTETDNVDPTDFDPTDMAFGDHGGTDLPSFGFDGVTIAGLTEPPNIPTFLPGDTNAVVDAAGTGGPGTDQRGVSRPQGTAADIGSVEVEQTGDDITVVVTPPSPTITYGQPTPTLTPTDDLPDGVSWTTPPACKVYDGATGTTEITSALLPAATYVVKCSGGTLPAGYTADYTATGTLTVNKATPMVTYSGASVVTSGSPINPSVALSPSGCTGAITYKIDGVTITGTTVLPDGTYEIEVIYAGDSNCEPVTTYAAITVGGTAAASSGGGWYNVSGGGVGRVNFGYTVQVNKSRTGSTQVSGQMVWNSQNGKFRFKGVITSFVKTTSDCGTSQVCGRITGTGTLRTRNDAGEWVVVGTGLAYKATVTDAGTASVCTGGRKQTCTTVNRPDFFGLDIAGRTFSGEQPLAASGWPTPVQLSGGNVLIK